MKKIFIYRDQQGGPLKFSLGRDTEREEYYNTFVGVEYSSWGEWLAGGDSYVMKGIYSSPSKATKPIYYDIASPFVQRGQLVGGKLLYWDGNDFTVVSDEMEIKRSAYYHVVYRFQNKQDEMVRCNGMYLFAQEDQSSFITKIRDESKDDNILFMIYFDSDYLMKPCLLDSSDKSYDWDNPANNRMKGVIGVFQTWNQTYDHVLALVKTVEADGREAVKVLYRSHSDLAFLFGKRATNTYAWMSPAVTVPKICFEVVLSDPNSSTPRVYLDDLFNKLAQESQQDEDPIADKFVSA